MRRNFLIERNPSGVFQNHPAYTAVGQSASAPVQEQGFLVVRGFPVPRRPAVDIMLGRLQRYLSNRNDPFFLSFASHANNSAKKIHVLAVQPNQLTDTQA